MLNKFKKKYFLFFENFRKSPKFTKVLSNPAQKPVPSSNGVWGFTRGRGHVRTRVRQPSLKKKVFEKRKRKLVFSFFQKNKSFPSSGELFQAARLAFHLQSTTVESPGESAVATQQTREGDTTEGGTQEVQLHRKSVLSHKQTNRVTL